MDKIEPYKGIAGIYEQIRPSYPEQLIQDVIDKTETLKTDYLLEIGAGTGKATMQFAQKGYKIQAIEIGEDMAEILRDKCSSLPNVTVDVTPFETWSCPTGQKYDMIYCAQAFHWIDKNIKYKKCHDLLRDQGYLALFWYAPDYDKLPATEEIENEVNQIVGKYISNNDPDKGTPERRAHDGVNSQDERIAEIEASGLFKFLEKLEYIQEIRNNSWQYLLAMKSVPAFASFLDHLEKTVIEKMDHEIEEVINKHGGYISGLFRFSLYIAKKL